MKNIILIGLPGSGKTTLGAAVALKFGLDFYDMDAEIEKESAKSISEIFAESGEDYFRDLEEAEALRAADLKKTVVSTGGGIVLRENNMSILRESGLVIFIDRPPELIVGEICNDNRPLLNADAGHIYKMNEVRRRLYIDYSHAILINDATADEALEKLILLVRSEYPGAGFGVIGDPIRHSLSPFIHNTTLMKFKHIGNLAEERWNYIAVQVPSGRLEAFINAAKQSDMRGFNVTAPHKQAIIPYLDELDEEAAVCGAVNTVVIRNGRLKGYNTDMGGLFRALNEKGLTYRNNAVTLLGAGGAAAGVAIKAAMEGAAAIRILSRRKEQAEALADRVRDYLNSTPETGKKISDERKERNERNDALAAILLSVHRAAETALTADTEGGEPVYPSVNPPARPPGYPVYPTARPPEYPSVNPPASPPADPTARPPEYLSLNPPARPPEYPVYPTASPPADPTARPPEYPSVNPPASPPPPVYVEALAMDQEAMKSAAKKTDILINATPLGMEGKGQFEDLDFLKALPKDAVVCDLVYSPPETELLKKARSEGIDGINGYDMLVYQAVLADVLFIGDFIAASQPETLIFPER